ncbi:uncharacterized protein LOC142760804 [Rhinoderma darwinii]|uniref:uncharacterized protein LOC142760804 n=1 Tax=Rhinoderma darwinii TaxID=43563 RepID=UPI003F672FD4
MRVWWNKVALEQYLTKDLIPRGLRVQVFPSFTFDDTMFRSRWEEACKSCSRTFIELLIGWDKKQLEEIEKLILPLQEKVKTELTSDLLSKFEHELSLEYTKWENDIKELKSKKYQRDLMDFQEQRVYKWQRRGVNTMLRSESLSSLDSATSGASQGSQPMKTRRYETRRNPTKRKFNPLDDNVGGELKVINLSDIVFTPSQISVLSLGLSFCPVTGFDDFLAIKDVFLFARKLIYKKYHSKNEPHHLFTAQEELEAVRALESLLQEQEVSNGYASRP